MYNWVKNVLFDGQKTSKTFSERRGDNKYLNELKKKFETAYNTAYKGNGTSTNYHVSENLSNDLDNVLNNLNERNPVKLRDFIPDVLVQNGVKNLPMYENPSHIRKNILTNTEAQQLGLQISNRDHYHGLGKETYIKAIDSLDEPRAIFKNKNNGNYLILTVVKDNNNNNIVVPIEIETTTNVNNLKIDTNRVKTVYGYQMQNNIDLNDYIRNNIKNNVFEKVYEQKKRKVRALAPQQSLTTVYHQQTALSITSICKMSTTVYNDMNANVNGQGKLGNSTLENLKNKYNTNTVVPSGQTLREKYSMSAKLSLRNLALTPLRKMIILKLI